MQCRRDRAEIQLDFRLREGRGKPRLCVGPLVSFKPAVPRRVLQGEVDGLGAGIRDAPHELPDFSSDPARSAGARCQRLQSRLAVGADSNFTGYSTAEEVARFNARSAFTSAFARLSPLDLHPRQSLQRWASWHAAAGSACLS